MGDKTGIEWTDATWNPIVGCTIVSPGCTNCYAMKFAANRLDGNPKAPHYAGTTKKVNGNPVWTGKVALAPEHILTAPLRWKKPRRIFVNSMGDLFHEDVPDAWIDKMFAVMALCPQHTFQVLTKRSKRMRSYTNYNLKNGCGFDRVLGNEMRSHLNDAVKRGVRLPVFALPLPNVWLGVSAEDQARADERIPDLLATPAAVRWVSAEPLIGPIIFNRINVADHGWQDSLSGWRDCGDYPGREETLNWIVAGGESGPGARPMHPDWARSIRDQCQAAGVPFFFKQWGEWIDADALWVTLAKSGADIPFSMIPGPAGLNYEQATTLAGSRPIEHHSDGSTMIRIGKSRAGRLLDGRTHDDYPSTEH